MTLLTKMPTSNSTWHKIVDLANSAGVETPLDRNLSCRYGGRADRKIDEKLIKFENKRLMEDELSLKKSETSIKTDSNQSTSELNSEAETTDISVNKNLEHAEKDAKLSHKTNQKPVDAPVSSSLRHFCFKGDARYAARRMFHSVMPHISAQLNPEIARFPQLFEIPFLHKRYILVLRTASRKQAEYLFNKALKFNPIELLRPPSYRGSGGAEAALAASAAGSTAATTAAVVAAC